MTKKEAQIRNSKIMQFRGLAHRIRSLIPDDIWNELGRFDKIIINDVQKSYERVTKILDSKAKCRHKYYENLFKEKKCCVCRHTKYARDGLGKAGTF